MFTRRSLHRAARPAGALPDPELFAGTRTGSEVMQRIAAPMIGGMVTAPLLSMMVLPAIYLLIHSRRARRPPQ
jgi:Cu(I)/Ag(I) efflux system membrane protein CusA/SilA